MKISVITVVRNGEKTIGDTLSSVAGQSHTPVEHIVIDGASEDHTLEIVRQFEHVHWLSEPDQGIYHAMNKGLALATGDIIGFLNADDVFAHENVLARVAREMTVLSVDICFADLVYVKGGEIVRHYSSARFTPARLRYGWMPAHPATYVRHDFFKKTGEFSLDYLIAADFEWMVRAFTKVEASWRYVPDVWVKMRTGGVSTRGLGSSWRLNREIVKACRSNGVPTSLALVLLKIPWKLLELWRPAKAG